MILSLVEEQLRAPRRVATLRSVIAGGDVVSPTLQDRFTGLFGTELLEIYAMTEVCAMSDQYPWRLPPRFDGRAAGRGRMSVWWTSTAAMWRKAKPAKSLCAARRSASATGTIRRQPAPPWAAAGCTPVTWAHGMATALSGSRGARRKSSSAPDPTSRRRRWKRRSTSIPRFWRRVSSASPTLSLSSGSRPLSFCGTAMPRARTIFAPSPAGTSPITRRPRKSISSTTAQNPVGKVQRRALKEMLLLKPRL